MGKIFSDVEEHVSDKQNPKEVFCYHCGANCATKTIRIEEKIFCCDGCQLVFEILNENGMCNYYALQNHPGLEKIKPLRREKYAYLDDETIAKDLYLFNDKHQCIVEFYIPNVHCASCIWLLDHLFKLNAGFLDSKLNFSTKELHIRFDKTKITLREVVELLTTIGYEPLLSFDKNKGISSQSANQKSRIYKLGIAGFCFGNIMMLSFPEYLGSKGIDQSFTKLFSYINLFLSIPVFFYCANEFFISAWKGLKQKTLNIDAPIALALLITFGRSVFEIISGTGEGFLDSMCGIVFFMLVGRVVQERTYRSLSFHRNYQSYFPIAVNVVTSGGITSKKLDQLAPKDVLQLHHEELIPADAILINGKANIDYSFVTGESEPVVVNVGEKLFAGGKQIGEKISIQIEKAVSASYLTSMWNHKAFQTNKVQLNKDKSMIHMLSTYFTYILFTLAAITALYWYFNNPNLILPSVSAMLIVACPCALLLASTFTNGNMLRILSNNGMYLRDASIIEQFQNANHIVFDKTGTLTNGNNIQLDGLEHLDDYEKRIIYAAVSSSRHPSSIALRKALPPQQALTLNSWEEIIGKGIKAEVDNYKILIGSPSFTNVQHLNANLVIRINEKIVYGTTKPQIRKESKSILKELSKKYKLSLLSGDQDFQQEEFEKIFPDKSTLKFNQKPIDKLQHIKQLQEQGDVVIMVGDGLNDAGAIQQSNVGITLSDDVNNFTPSCDAILDGNQLSKLPALIKLNSVAKTILMTCFVVSILYNIVGLYIAMKGEMSPMIAAILMPLSTLSIVLFSTGLSTLLSKRLGLK